MRDVDFLIGMIVIRLLLREALLLVASVGVLRGRLLRLAGRFVLVVVFDVAGDAAPKGGGGGGGPVAL